MPKYTLTITLCLFSYCVSFSQINAPEPCVEPAMTAFCETACVICDIDGFTGINDNPETGIAPDDFCTTWVHHISWIAFIAGSEDLTLEVTVTGCQINFGLEIGIYESLDCENYQQVSECNTNVFPNSTATFSNTQPLTVGQYYYFVMDGSAGDICNYTVKVTEGTTKVGFLDPVTEIEGPAKTCPNNLETFQVPEVPGANFSTWTVNGTVVSNEHEQLEIDFDNPGTYQICYSAFNVCDTLPPVCTSILVEAIPPIVFDEALCEGDSLYVLDTVFFEAGIYDFSYIDTAGCLQEVMGEIEIIPTAYTDLDLTFCFGDSVFFGGNAFTETGNYTVPLIGPTGCDSILTLDLLTFLCDIDGGFADDNLLCFGDDNGQLVFNLIDGNHPYTFEWEEETGTNATGSGVSNANSTTIVIPNLTAGIYSITITDASGSVGIFVGQVNEPFSISSDIEYSQYGVANVSCFEATDGSISIMPEMGVSPYFYNWSNGNQTSFDDNLSAGSYAVTITDSNGCTLVVSPSLSEPAPVSSTFDLIQPGCDPDDSGIINVLPEGGNSPYTYAIDGGDFSPLPSFGQLFPGQYILQVEDVFGCRYEDVVELLEPNTLVLDLEENLEICLGDSIQLTPFANEPNLEYVWTSSELISCPDCPRPFVGPYQNATYHLQAIMQNGCFQTDSINIIVNTFRKLYVPNVFSPNDDGLNDIFRIYPSKEVAMVLEFEIYNRWGAMVASYRNLLPHDGDAGWDGKVGEDLSDIGVYVWRASVQFLDGEVLEYQGDVTVLR